MITNTERPWTKSYDPGIEPEIPLPECGYGELIDESFARYAGLPASHFLGATMTFGELDEASRRFARYFVEIGCEPGDVVALALPNTPQYLIALAGAQRAGLVVSGLSLLFTASELAYQLNDCGAKALVCLDVIYEQKLMKIEEPLPQLTHVAVTNIGDFMPAAKRVIGRILAKIPTGKVEPLSGKTIVDFKQVLKDTPAEFATVRRSADDLILLQYTGGTTGFPKGAQLTHRGMSGVMEAANAWFGSDRGEAREVVCAAYPFFHIAGGSIGLNSMAHGHAQVLIPDPRNTGHICGEIAKYKPTHIYMVPSLFQMLMEDPAWGTLDFSGTKLFGSGAAPFAVETIRELEQAVGEGNVIEAYGMSETSGAVTANPFRNPSKVGSVGIPQPNVRVKIVDIETGTEEVPFGDEGEIIITGPQVMIGYHNKPEETAKALRDFQGETWLYTGDVGKMDEDGYIFIVDRVKDMINVGGFKVFSSEVEAKLNEHPSIEFCALVGVANPERPGSELVKVVIQRATEYADHDADALKAELTAFCKENLAPYKVPKFIEFVDQIPLTAVGKIDKKALR